MKTITPEEELEVLPVLLAIVAAWLNGSKAEVLPQLVVLLRLAVQVQVVGWAQMVRLLDLPFDPFA